MNIIHNLNQLEQPLKNPVLTIGNFDGVHKGHRALFQLVKDRAAAIGGQSAVMTFDPHPIKIMRPDTSPLLITLTEQKLSLIGNSGIDVILCLPFTKEFAGISAEDFVRKILVEKIGVREVVVGYDYSFGAGREGNISLLEVMGEELGFRIHVVEPVSIDGILVSSTSVRDLVRQGDLKTAKILLGRDYQIFGTVVKGMNRGGRLLGFPTANLEPVDELVPKEGVYAVNVTLDGVNYDAVTNIGNNPTFGNKLSSIETHLLDFSGDMLGKKIRVSFLERLRDEKAFKGIEELAEQIGRDIENARRIFKARADADRVESSL
jgi:riboflavin kinase/FMN adenylyltransferase